MRISPVLVMVCAALCLPVPAISRAPEFTPPSTLVRDAVPGEVIVQLSLNAAHDPDFSAGMLARGRTGLAALDARLEQLAAREIRPLFDLSIDPARKAAMGMDRVFVVRFDAPEEPATAVARLDRLPEVAWAEPNGLYHTMLAPNDTYYPQQWAHDNTGQAIRYGGGTVGTIDCDTDTDEAWDLQTGSSSLVLAIIDTGVDAGHPEFAGRMVAGYDFVNGDSDPMDDEGHGTCCAGIAGAAGNNAQGIAGVAWGIRLMPVKVLDEYGSGTWEAVANGITWAADHGARILSLSLGSSSPSSAVETAVNYAFGQGCALFCSAGNANSSSPRYPAAYANTISVGALSPCNERKNPSSCDGEYWWGSSYGTGLDFLAPGTRIHTTDIRGSGGYGGGDYIDFMNGTSAAAPHAAGIGALVWSQNPSLTNDQLRNNLRTHCDDLGESGYDPETGYGRLNAYRSVLHADSAGAPSSWVVFAEGFEWNAVPGDVWSASDANRHSGFDYWGDQSGSSGARVRSGNRSAYCALNSNVAGQRYDNNMNADMTLVEAIDISGYSDVRLSFWIWCRTPAASDYLSFQLWNGAGWVEQQRWFGSHHATWRRIEYAVSGSSLRFRFVFFSNHFGTQEGAYVDDIVVTGTPAATAFGGATTLACLGEWIESAVPEEDLGTAGPATARGTLRIAWSAGQRPTALLGFSLDRPGRVRLDVFGVDGRMVGVLQEGLLAAGSHARRWDGTGPDGAAAAAGVYYARLSLDGRAIETRPLLLVR